MTKLEILQNAQKAFDEANGLMSDKDGFTCYTQLQFVLLTSHIGKVLRSFKHRNQYFCITKHPTPDYVEQLIEFKIDPKQY